MKNKKLRTILCIIVSLVLVITGYILISRWIGGRPKLKYDVNTNSSALVTYPDAEFAVLSDLHIYDPALGNSGPAFETALLSDRKLLLDGIDLLDFAIGEILRSNAQFVLISGDLTKDGELACHNIVAQRLAKLTEAGLKVYVIPGNHDINNPDAVSYSGDATMPVDSIQPEDFARIYAGFGYREALDRDRDSLSYLAEPVEGLWLLAIDSCRYRENKPGKGEIVGGKISQATADWIANILREASQSNKAVMVMEHHGIVEHWDGQHKLHPDYLIRDYKHFGEFLASYDVRLAFTGHYHAQDITQGYYKDKYLYDIQTGSLVTAPSPLRFCSIKDNSFFVESEMIIDLLRPDTDFARQATEFVKATVVREAITTLKKYMVSDSDAELIADAVGDAFAAHYKGDEVSSDRPGFDKSLLNIWGRLVLSLQQYVLDGLWYDLYPADNNASFHLG